MCKIERLIRSLEIEQVNTDKMVYDRLNLGDKKIHGSWLIRD
jgi:hypothetical protein